MSSIFLTICRQNCLHANALVQYSCTNCKMQPSLFCLPSLHGSNNTSLVLLMSLHLNFTCVLNVIVVFMYNVFEKYAFSRRARTCAGAQEASAARIAKYNGGAGCAGGSPPARQGCPAAHALAFQL